MRKTNVSRLGGRLWVVVVLPEGSEIRSQDSKPNQTHSAANTVGTLLKEIESDREFYHLSFHELEIWSEIGGVFVRQDKP